MTIKYQPQKFADGWLRHHDASRAYIEADYKARGASARSAANRLLQHVDVVAYITKQTTALAKRDNITLDDTVALQWGLAQDNNQPGHVRAQAGMNTAKLLGYVIDRKQSDVTTTQVAAGIDILTKLLDAGKLTEDDIREMYATPSPKAIAAPIIDVDSEPVADINEA